MQDTQTPITGASPVAKTAPNIPILQGNINTQSRRMFERLPVTVEAIARRGAPSLRTKHTSTLLSVNAGENSRSTLKYISVISYVYWSAPRRRAILPERNTPTSTKITENAAARYKVLVNTAFALSSSPLLLKTEYLVAPPIPSISPVP